MKVLVIDPLSSGPELVAHLCLVGCDVTEYSQKIAAVAHENWMSVSLDKEVIELAETGEFDAIVAGSDFGVVAAEVLSAREGLPVSHPDQIWARRDKAGMAEAVANTEVKVPQTWTVDALGKVDEIWCSLKDLPNGVVVKPSASAGSDGCFICFSREDVFNAVRSLLGERNLLGTINSRITIQERIVGTQYFLNTVTVDGLHYVTEFFRYGIDESLDRPQIYNAITLPMSGKLFESAKNFTCIVNDALGVAFGASHVEMRLQDEEWVLIEFNGRSMGPTVPDDVYLVSRGYSQVSVWAAAIAGGAEAAALALERARGSGCVGWHMPQPTEEGLLLSANWQEIEMLSTFQGIYGELSIGSLFSSQKRVTTGSYGLAFFASEERTRVESDLDLARAVELSGQIYRISASPKGRKR